MPEAKRRASGGPWNGRPGMHSYPLPIRNRGLHRWAQAPCRREARARQIVCSRFLICRKAACRLRGLGVTKRDAGGQTRASVTAVPRSGTGQPTVRTGRIGADSCEQCRQVNEVAGGGRSRARPRHLRGFDHAVGDEAVDLPPRGSRLPGLHRVRMNGIGRRGRSGSVPGCGTAIADLALGGSGASSEASSFEMF